MSLTEIVSDIDCVHRKFITLGLHYDKTCNQQCSTTKEHHNVCYVVMAIAAAFAVLLYNTNIVSDVWSYTLGVRCILPNNYFIWEATRPISDCAYCQSDSVTILHNVTAQSFEPYAYTSKPMLLKGAARDWPAVTQFTLDYFRELYAQYTDDDICQFLHFKSKFDSLSDVFTSSTTNEWYVGWANCQPDVLSAMRRFYPARPPFLPADSELPARDYVFMGYGVGLQSEGATMHIDFIGRLMWQAQLQGVKRWRLLPINECEDSCRCSEGGIEFTAQPGDVVLVDTRLWYHETNVLSTGEFSVSIQSEYG